jgi:hypothetical protein
LRQQALKPKPAKEIPAMNLTSLDLFLWAGGLLGHLILLLVLCFRRRVRSFPLFTALIAVNVVRTVTLYLVRAGGTNKSYFFTYWSLALFDTILQLCVVYEIASRVFRPLNIWAADLRNSFPWLLGLSICVALGLAWLESPPAGSWMQSVTARGDLFVAALMSELFVAMTALSFSARFPWRTHVAAIAQGLGAYALISVLIETAHSYFGLAGNAPASILLSHLRMIVYLGCVAYWTIALYCEERRTRIMTREMHQEIFTLQSQLAIDLRQLRSRTKE